MRRLLPAFAVGLAIALSGCDRPEDKKAAESQPANTPIASPAPPARAPAPTGTQPPAAAPAQAQPPAPAPQRQPVAAKGTGFDFYVLALSWSPTYCATDTNAAKSGQCRRDRDLAFIVHGLWPQFEKGYPERCATRESDRVPDELVRRIIDLIPSAGLIGHQWRKHGTCTGLSQQDYFAAVREARARVVVPDRFANATTAGKAEPQEVERAFMTLNPGLKRDAIAVTCGDGKLDEVRVCMGKDLAFRACPEVDRQSCRAASVDVPAAP